VSLKSNVGSIPLYRADCGLCTHISEQQLRQLELASVVARVVRSRKGQIKRAILFAQASESTPRSAAALMATRYSFNEHLRDGSRCWKLRRVDPKGDDSEVIDGRAAFQSVVEGCIV
jgi:hypothetical protein